MIVRVFCLLSVITALSHPFPKQVLEQRLCMTLQAGFSAIEGSLSAILHDYARFWNHPNKFRYQMQNT